MAAVLKLPSPMSGPISSGVLGVITPRFTVPGSSATAMALLANSAKTLLYFHQKILHSTGIEPELQYGAA